MMTNMGNTVLYTGITNNLRRRVYEHEQGASKGFTLNIEPTNWFIMNHFLWHTMRYQERNKLKPVLERRKKRLSIL